MTKLNPSELYSRQQELVRDSSDLSAALWEKFPELAKLEDSQEEEKFIELTALSEEQRDEYFALKRAMRAVDREFVDATSMMKRSRWPSYLQNRPCN